MNTARFILILIVFLSFTGCEDIFEKDISKERIILLSPPDSLVTTIMLQSFWWEEVEGADYYTLQIVSPSFSQIIQLLTDTNVYSTKFNFSLLPGIYEWRVKAVNFGYSSPFSVNRLIIDSTPDISHQTIRLIVPPDYDTTNFISILFDWEGLYNADNYNFQLFYHDDRFISEDIEADSITSYLPEGDGPYTWKVRGQNFSSNTPYSSRSIFLDTQAPGIPQLVSPPANGILPDSLIEFRWIRYSHDGSSVKDSLHIATDSFFIQPVVKIFLSETSYIDSLGKGTFFWRVCSIDKAGNKSGFSPIWKFIVKIKVFPDTLSNGDR